MVLISEIIQLNYFKNKEILEIEAETSALSNQVYMVMTKDQKYIVKIFSPNEVYSEHCVPIEFEQHPIFKNELFGIYNFIESEKYFFAGTQQLLAEATKKIHCKVLENERSFIDLFYKLKTWNLKTIKKFKVIDSIYDKCVKLLKVCYFVPCHNDLQPGNILKLKNELFIIDFEFGALNDPLYEIANIFCEVMCDYKDNGKIKKELSWTKDEKIIFLRHYLWADKSVEGGVENCNKFIKKYIESMSGLKKQCKVEIYKIILDRIELLENVSHYFWFLWARKKIFENFKGSDFNYLEYAKRRVEMMLQNNFIKNEEAVELLLCLVK